VTSTPFEDIVAQHGPVVLRVCRALLARADADDAWSETFLSALRAYPDLREDSNVRGWLVTIAHRKALDHLRRASRSPSPRADVPEAAGRSGPSGPPEALDDDLRLALLALPDKQQAAVVHRYLADRSYAEVAEVLGTTEAAARRSAADGIAALRRTYRKEPIR
jgi:RNA polymerase sigma factor (sigma-70 family)